MSVTPTTTARLELQNIAEKLRTLSPLVTRARLRRSERNAFELGRDYERDQHRPVSV
jgi:hypothetical protein